MLEINAYKILVGNYEGESPCGKPGYRWGMMGWVLRRIEN
jgi:hypothetical protein